MEPIKYDCENYNFKKAMQDNINKNFAVLLRENGFKKYKLNRFAREQDGIVHIIGFSNGVRELKVYTYFLPIYVLDDCYISYGIELTKLHGGGVLGGGKYYTFIFNIELTKQEQYKAYCARHMSALQKIYLAIEEGIIPEMDEMDSLEKFIVKLEKPGCCFWGKSIEEFRGTNLYNYVIGIYQCVYGDYNKGMEALKRVKAMDDKMNEVENKFLNMPKEEFATAYQEICDRMRRYYKFIK